LAHLLLNLIPLVPIPLRLPDPLLPHRHHPLQHNPVPAPLVQRILYSCPTKHLLHPLKIPKIPPQDLLPLEDDLPKRGGDVVLQEDVSVAEVLVVGGLGPVVSGLGAELQGG